MSIDYIIKVIYTYLIISGNPSPRWKGEGWYRMKGPAGTKLPETGVTQYFCGTEFPLFTNGTHPTTVGETVDRHVGFDYFGTSFFEVGKIQIRNCGAYFLYYFPEHTGCFRYCAE